MLTASQSEQLESLQRKALKIIFGYKTSYATAIEEAGIERLSVRRSSAVDKFILKAVKNPRFCNEWFPKKPFYHKDLRKEMVFIEKYARTERLYNSPLYYYRRRLNEIYTPPENTPEPGL